MLLKIRYHDSLILWIKLILERRHLLSSGILFPNSKLVNAAYEINAHVNGGEPPAQPDLQKPTGCGYPDAEPRGPHNSGYVFKTFFSVIFFKEASVKTSEQKHCRIIEFLLKKCVLTQPFKRCLLSKIGDKEGLFLFNDVILFIIRIWVRNVQISLTPLCFPCLCRT